MPVQGLRIGIAGFGHLGSSLAAALVRNGFSTGDLLISYGGSAATRERACALGFGDCLTDGATLAGEADVVVLAARPQDVRSLAGPEGKRGAHWVSCMAGLSAELLRIVFRRDVARMMCSGPDSIAEGAGIAALLPGDARTRALLGAMGLRTHTVGGEAELDAFTIGICIPAMLMNIPVEDAEVRAALRRMAKPFPVYGVLGEWVRDILARNGRAAAGDVVAARLEGVSTKGGVTEAMTAALRRGTSFEAALRLGIARAGEIRDGIAREVMAAVGLAG